MMTYTKANGDTVKRNWIDMQKTYLTEERYNILAMVLNVLMRPYGEYKFNIYEDKFRKIQIEVELML